MSRYSILFLLVVQATLVSAQQALHTDLLAMDSSWTREVFPFPLGFAPDIPYKGIEEALFPKNWADTSSAEHWSYVFVWNIEADSALTKPTLEHHLQTYFNGLMRWQHTSVALVESEEKSAFSVFTGKIKTLDSFFSKKPMILNVLVSSQYCDTQKKALVFFKLSPQEFGHEIWHKLNCVRLIKPACAP